MLAFVSESDGPSCYFCGWLYNSKHPHSSSPAKDTTCAKCHKRGHYAKVFCGEAFSKGKVSAATCPPTLAPVQSPKFFLTSTATVNIGGLQVKALFDSGSTATH